MMETSKKSRTLDWVLFFISTVVFVAMLIYTPQWFWLALPFVLTYLTRALDMM